VTAAVISGAILLAILYDVVWVAPHRRQVEAYLGELVGHGSESKAHLLSLIEQKKGNVVHAEYRQCIKSDGTAKRAYASFDEAQAKIATRNLVNRQHAYRCPLHGWHLGNNIDTDRKQRGRVA